MNSIAFSKLYIDQQVAHLPQVTAICSRLKIPVEIIEDVQTVYQLVSSADDPVQKGKNTLLLTRNKGAFIKNCPGTHAYTCCGYKILHIGTYCSMDCSYCILQSYFHPPLLQYYVNYDDLLAELDRLFLKKIVSRVGTGEFTDSMIWERLADLSGVLVPKFARQVHAVLELKTKTTAIKELKQLRHNRKTIVAWSLNTNRVIANEERRTASLDDRLQAAAECESWGYPLAFHFDPLVIYDGCENDYREVVQHLFNHVSTDNIAWISLGSLRFMPSLKPIIQRRFPKSKIVYGEFIPGLDGKMRYFKPLRIEIYRQIVTWIRETAPDVLIYFCMEDDEVWEKVMGFIPAEQGSLSNILDQGAIRVCGLTPNS